MATIFNSTNSNRLGNFSSDYSSKYLGTSYILSKKADFEPRKNIRLHIKNKFHKRFI